jgi:hypothetical protein
LPRLSYNENRKRHKKYLKERKGTDQWELKLLAKNKKEKKGVIMNRLII